MFSSECLACRQVVIVPILKKNADSEAVLAAADAIAAAAKAAGIRVKVDASTGKTPGFKFSFWEMKVGSLSPRMPFGGTWLSSLHVIQWAAAPAHMPLSMYWVSRTECTVEEAVLMWQ